MKLYFVVNPLFEGAKLELISLLVDVLGGMQWVTQ
jgi:hypothetical protein